jgi:copper chaperone CopZ
MLTLTITGMTCEHCVKTVTALLKKLPGVTEVKEVSLARGVAVVLGSPDVTKLCAALADEGYEARVAA